MAAKHYSFDITLDMITANDCSSLTPVTLCYEKPKGGDDDTVTYTLVGEAASKYDFRPGAPLVEKNAARNRLKWLKIAPGKDSITVSMKANEPKWSDGDFLIALREKGSAPPKDVLLDPTILNGGGR